MLHFVDLGEPVTTRLEKALKSSGHSFKANYANFAAPLIINGLAYTIADAADRYLPGGWEGIFA